MLCVHWVTSKQIPPFDFTDTDLWGAPPRTWEEWPRRWAADTPSWLGGRSPPVTPSPRTQEADRTPGSRSPSGACTGTPGCTWKTWVYAWWSACTWRPRTAPRSTSSTPRCALRASRSGPTPRSGWTWWGRPCPSCSPGPAGTHRKSRSRISGGSAARRTGSRWRLFYRSFWSSRAPPTAHPHCWSLSCWSWEKYQWPLSSRQH